MRTIFFLCISVLRVASRHRVKLASCKSAFTSPPPPAQPHPVVYSTDRSKVVVPVLVSLLLCGVFYEAICCMSFRVSFCSYVFSVLLVLRLPRLGKRELILVLFLRLFGLCLFGFPLPLGVWEGLRFVIVALPGLFSYLFFTLCCFVVYSSKLFVLCLTLCYFVLVISVLLALRLPRLGKRERERERERES